MHRLVSCRSGNGARGLIALAVALITVCASIVAWLYLQAGPRTPVVVLAADVPYGDVIERFDLTTVAVAGSISAVPVQGLDGVVGQTAAVHLLAGTVLQRSMVTTLPAPPEESAHVGALRPSTLHPDREQP